MTPQEEQQLRAYMLRMQSQGMDPSAPPITMESQVSSMANAPLSSGMTAGMGPAGGGAPPSPYDDPNLNQNFKPQERRISRMEGMADQLRGKEMAQGKEVGPLDVYVGPNWGEQLAYAGQQAMGGYYQNKANKADEALDVDRVAGQDAERALQKALYDTERGDKERGFGIQEGAAANTAAQLTRAISNDARSEVNTQEGLRLQREAAGRAEKALENAESKRTRSTVIDTANPAKGPVDVLVGPRGGMTYASGEKKGEEVPDGYENYNTWTDNDRQERALLKAGDDKAMVRQVDKLDARMIKYGKDLQKANIPDMKQAATELNDMLEKLPGFERNEDGSVVNVDIEVPGTGYGQNMPFAGGFFTAVEQATTNSDKKYGGVTPTAFRAGRQKISNALLKLQSGAAVTVPEMLRSQIAMATASTTSDADFLTLWPKIQRGLEAVEGNFNSTYGPEVTDLYEIRQGGEAMGTREYLKGLSGSEEMSLEDQIKELEDALK